MRKGQEYKRPTELGAAVLRRWMVALTTAVAALLSTPVQAQDDLEYLMDVGGSIGMVGYLGDFNGSLTKCLQPMGTLQARYKFTPRMAAMFNLGYGKLKGKSTDTSTFYPDYQEEAYEFNRNLVDASLHYEFNFLPYGTGADYRGAKRITPYTTIGLGLTYAWGGEAKKALTMNIPVGFGVKYKAADRINVGLEWTMRFSMSDELDGVKDPYRIESKGLFKNTDCYQMLQLSVSYDIWAKCKICNNNDD